MRFIGNIVAKVDTKGRVFLPSVFRKVLRENEEERLVMRKEEFSDCLTLFPESVWNERLDELRSRLNRWNAAHKNLFRQYVSDAEIVELDSNGRFLIPKRYLQMAGIEQGVKFLGMDDTVEIWSVEKTEKPFMEVADFSRSLQEIMGGVTNIVSEA